jgi:hypothetical protein
LGDFQVEGIRLEPKVVGWVYVALLAVSTVLKELISVVDAEEPTSVQVVMYPDKSV